MCREDISNGDVSRRDLASSHKFLHRVNGSFTRTRKRANSSDPRPPLLNHTQFRVRGPIMPVGTARFCCDVAVPTAINIAFAPTLNDGAAVPTRVSTSAQFSIVVLPTTDRAKPLGILGRCKFYPSGKVFIALNTYERPTRRLARAARGTHPRHRCDINRRRKSTCEIIAHTTTCDADNGTHGPALLALAKRSLVFRTAKKVRGPFSHGWRAIRRERAKSTRTRFTVSAMWLWLSLRRGCRTRATILLVHTRRMSIAKILTASLTRKKCPFAASFSSYTRSRPCLITLRVITRSHSGRATNGQKVIRMGTVGPSATNGHTPAINTPRNGRRQFRAHLSRRVHACALTILAFGRRVTHKEIFATLPTYPRTYSLCAKITAIPVQRPRRGERDPTAPARVYQNQLSPILGVSKSALL